jgi:putative sterol carrier protein
MTGAIFDGVMSGQIYGTSAAMTGKIRYSGDMMKAMSLQRIQKDMTRLYSQVRVDQPR